MWLAVCLGRIFRIAADLIEDPAGQNGRRDAASAALFTRSIVEFNTRHSSTKSSPKNSISRNRTYRSVLHFAESGSSQVQFVVGFKIEGKTGHVVVDAEDALIAALEGKTQRPEALIAYVRQQNKRGDTRHPMRRLSSGNA
jgi:hypothetical protein